MAVLPFLALLFFILFVVSLSFSVTTPNEKKDKKKKLKFISICFLLFSLTLIFIIESTDKLAVLIFFCLLGFIPTLISGITGFSLKKSWSKHMFLTSLSFLALTAIFFSLYNAFDAAPTMSATDSSPSSTSSIDLTELEDLEEFDFSIVSANTNLEENSMTVIISTNLPDGVEANVTLNKMWESDKGFKEFDDPLLQSLRMEEERVIEDGEINMQWDKGLSGDPIINGEYGVSLTINSDSIENQPLFDAMGPFEVAEKKFSNLYKRGNQYHILLGQKYFEVNDSISFAEYHTQKEEQLQDRKNTATTIRFAELEKNPEKHNGEFVKYSGQIVQILEDEDSTDIRLSVTKSSYGYSLSDIIYITYKGTTPFVKDDLITIYGTIQGSYSYKSQAGYHISLPLIEAEIIE